MPPVANFKEVDPELGPLNLSKGGAYPVEYALRLGAGFGSQISMTLLRWVATKDGVRRSPNALGYAYRIADQNVWNAWLSQMAGHPAAELEVVKRTLRVRDQGAIPLPEKPAAVPIAVQRPAARKEAVRSAAPASTARAGHRRRSGERTHPGAGGREDRLSRRHAGSRSRSRGRPGRRHSQAGGGVCRHPRIVRHRARRARSGCATSPRWRM